MPIRTFRDLIAFQRALDLSESVFKLTRWLRSIRHFNLATQLERAAISVVANIAEGFGRESRTAFANFLSISLGSLRETEALTLVSERLHAPEALITDVLEKADGAGKALFGLRKSVRKTDHSRPRPTTDNRS